MHTSRPGSHLGPLVDILDRSQVASDPASTNLASLEDIIVHYLNDQVRSGRLMRFFADLANMQKFTVWQRAIRSHDPPYAA